MDRVIPAFRLSTPAKICSARIKACLAKQSFSDRSRRATTSVSSLPPPAKVRRFQSCYSGQIESPARMKGTVQLGELGQGTWTGRRYKSEIRVPKCEICPKLGI